MGHAHTNLLFHIVFSTKDRAPWLDAELKPRLFAYMGGILRKLGGTALLINGPNDHVHVLAVLPAKTSVAEIVGKLKANSSGWVHREVPGAMALCMADGLCRVQRQPFPETGGVRLHRQPGGASSEGVVSGGVRRVFAETPNRIRSGISLDVNALIGVLPPLTGLKE